MVAAVSTVSDYAVDRPLYIGKSLRTWQPEAEPIAHLDRRSDVAPTADAWLQKLRARQTPSVDEAVAERFYRLCREWRTATAPLSSATEIILHPAYQQIIGLGRVALPLILAELVREPGHWSWALFAITGENPVSAEDAGRMDRMRDAWLQLAEEKGWSRGRCTF